MAQEEVPMTYARKTLVSLNAMTVPALSLGRAPNCVIGTHR